MPELPEVETVRSGLETIFHNQPVILSVRLLRPDLRFPIPKKLIAETKGQAITGVRRRAKYLLIDTPRGTLLSHLGMTGSWRLREGKEKLGTHDHVVIELQDGRELIFRDPRRFGLLDFIQVGKEAQHPRLKHLGPEPLEEERFHADYLFTLSRKRNVAVKTFIMDQKVVVGVGNIYASEVLFRAGVSPRKIARRLTLANVVRLITEIRGVLKQAIAAGGSSISDYRQADGSEGGYQNAHQVYGRAGEPCITCGAKIRAKVIGGRNTFWCAICQK